MFSCSLLRATWSNFLLLSCHSFLGYYSVTHRTMILLIKSLNFARLLEDLAVKSFSSHILDTPSTAYPNHHLHCSTSAVPGSSASRHHICMDLRPIAARWYIVLQNESNRKRTACHARADCAGGEKRRYYDSSSGATRLRVCWNPEHVMDVMDS